MTDYIEGRDYILQALREELVGPSPQGKELDCTQNLAFADIKAAYGPWRQQGSGEEILMRDSPRKRYGIGVLYPRGIEAEESELEPNTKLEATEAIDKEKIVTESAQASINKIEERADIGRGEAEADDFDLSTTTTYRPSSMGISFLADIEKDTVLVVEASGGRYCQQTVQVPNKELLWWLRSPISIRAEFHATDLCTSDEAKIPTRSIISSNIDDLDLRVEVLSRPYQTNQKRLITVCLVNRKEAKSLSDHLCLFQARFEVAIISLGGKKQRAISPYPEPVHTTDDNENRFLASLDEEEQSLTLLYRKANTFAVGHGCAANWESPMENQEASEKVEWVKAESLPAFETPSITPDIKRDDGEEITVAMNQLAGLIPDNDGFAALAEIMNLYTEWIIQRRQEILLLHPRYQAAATRHIDLCTRCITRMQEGLRYLQTNPKALRAFQLANHAILLQQVRSDVELRKVQYDAQQKRITFTEEYKEPDLTTIEMKRGKWRAFQIAFLLMAIQSTAEPTDRDRKTVELIWFPTGGGKTEAYLGLAAFALFMRRLDNTQDTGVQVLMRYTLRLLTAQQFQRASGLICAMEFLRRRNINELGSCTFSIGIWLGGSTTPNTRREAIDILNKLNRNERYAENQFLLSKCPWCRAQMGPLTSFQKRSRLLPPVLGYERQGNTVIFTCPDVKCTFTHGIPVYVIDEDIYEQCPSILIGTVDKFALLAWRPEARALFGIDQNGIRQSSPPNLIIQDELHLISGPLGSVVGLYETVIEELCTDRRTQMSISPKIVSSTATIRRYEQQIKALYARDEVALFPPPGLSADDSFFARYTRDSSGRLKRGRTYVGVHAPGLGSLQTAQVRSFTALLQASLALPIEQRDPWWTLLLFFNSLRELGTTLSLFQSDIPDYFHVLMRRMGFDFSQIRKFWHVLELTGRLRNEEVPEAIAKLEVKYEGSKENVVDVCLASNIIEVGIDIDRLSLMAVVGQPKTTSQYIQVTGRVGRRWWERPGLVVTLYNASKPRDRSHFERFRSYHERLYTQVEPTSVTPFSPPVLDRALHAILVSYIQQLGDRNMTRSPYPYPQVLVDQLLPIVRRRVEAIDEQEIDNFQRVFDRRVAEWQNWQRKEWHNRSGEDVGLLRKAGAYVSREQAQLSWPTAQSMRDVDAQCEAIITDLYAMEGEANND